MSNSLQQRDVGRWRIRSRHAWGWSLFAVLGVTTFFYAFCPRPDLYGDIPFSAAVNDRHDR
jgi:hypothetical protein